LGTKKQEKASRGWLPKTSLPSNQTISLFSRLTRLQVVQIVYGVMLGGLLVMPFGVYHSISEPYIVGSLWGYQLPIGYVGVLLGILAVLYPKLGKLKTLRFSSLMIVIGVSLLSSFALIPSGYFINLLHGTSFSPSQIDVDFALGNSVVFGLALLSIVFGLGSFIRGWLPKELNVSSQQQSPPTIRVANVRFGILLIILSFAGSFLCSLDRALGLGIFTDFVLYVFVVLLIVCISVAVVVAVLRRQKAGDKKWMS